MRPQLVQRTLDHVHGERLAAGFALPEQLERDPLGRLSRSRAQCAPNTARALRCQGVIDASLSLSRGCHNSCANTRGLHRRTRADVDGHLRANCVARQRNMGYARTHGGGPRGHTLSGEADLKSAQCRFESDWGHGKRPGRCYRGEWIGSRPLRPGVTPARGGISADACAIGVANPGRTASGPSNEQPSGRCR